MSENIQVRNPRGSQDTSNPVLDSTVNICAGKGTADVATIRAVHETLLELAAKEPGGLRYH